jgi:hypothetical protein
MVMRLLARGCLLGFVASPRHGAGRCDSAADEPSLCMRSFPLGWAAQTNREGVGCREAADRQPGKPSIPEQATVLLAHRLGHGPFRERPSLRGHFSGPSRGASQRAP